MAAVEVKTFIDIIDAVREELGVQSGDTTATNKIKRAINYIYRQKVVPRKRWWWIEKESEVVHLAQYNGELSTTTASVTNDSVTVTLSDAPDVGLGSFLNQKFSTDGFDEIYRISAHTAGNATITLSSKYQGATNATSAFKVWRDRFDLPTDARETFEIWHDRFDLPMKGTGPQEFIKISLEGNKREGFPIWYNTLDFFDPSAGDPETELDRFRQVEIYPALNNENVTLHFKYIQEITPLDADADEPVMPIEDRIVLVDGALWKTWKSIGRNPEAAIDSKTDFVSKLNEMAARIEDSFDTPRIAPKTRYLRAQRVPVRHTRNSFRNF